MYEDYLIVGYTLLLNVDWGDPRVGFMRQLYGGLMLVTQLIIAFVKHVDDLCDNVYMYPDIPHSARVSVGSRLLRILLPIQ